MYRNLADLIQAVRAVLRRGLTCEDRRAQAATASRFRLRTFTLTLTFILTLSNISALSADTLETKNPFLPPGYGQQEVVKPAPVVQTNGPISREIEFRGLVKLNGAYQFSLFSKSDQKSYWLGQNEAARQGISVRGYDADSRTITVNLNGRSERLTLMTANDAPLPVVVSVTQPSNNNNAAAPNLPPELRNAINNNSGGDNRRRVIPRRRVILPKQ